jgi:hypothetical protein
MKHAKLFAQDSPGNKHRFNDGGQVRIVCDELPNPSLELDRADNADLEAEVAQRATEVVLDVARLGLQQFAAS